MTDLKELLKQSAEIRIQVEASLDRLATLHQEAQDIIELSTNITAS